MLVIKTSMILSVSIVVFSGCGSHKVYKQSKGKATHTNIILLDSEQRVEEIAAMLSDQTVSQAAREAARELLN